MLFGTSLGSALEKRMKKLRKQRGVTLMELMIAVVIVGILAAIAVPSYQQYVIRANRSAVQTFMLSIANRQEQFILDKRQYATGSSIAEIADALNVQPPEATVQANYGVAVTHRNAPDPATPNPRTYLITATPVTGSRQTADGALTLNELGQKTPADKW
jgi:type IV pilus assembly protein PilE